jgi:4-hydroxy-tetrahydrodipicolinate synthase
MATPFKESGAIDFEGVGKNLEHYVASGIHGVMAAGTLGEYLSMSIEERKELAEYVGKYLAGRIPFMVGTTAHQTGQVIELTNHAKKQGAAGVMILPPPGMSMLEDEILAYYKQIAFSVDIPIMMYNNPGSSGMDINFDLVAKITELPNVEAIKEASGDIKRITRIATELDGKLAPFCGWEDMHFESFCVGAAGWVCMGANFAPGLARDMFNTFVDGDIQKARELSKMYTPLARYMETAGKVTQTTKYIMKKVGLAGGEVRAPKQPLTAEEIANIEAVLKGVTLY